MVKSMIIHFISILIKVREVKINIENIIKKRKSNSRYASILVHSIYNFYGGIMLQL